MVLTGDVAFVRTHFTNWLVVAVMSVLELEDIGSGSFCQELIAHADTAYRFVAGYRFSDVLNSNVTHIRVARAVADE